MHKIIISKGLKINPTVKTFTRKNKYQTKNNQNKELIKYKN